jgi:hypothetical protein
MSFAVLCRSDSLDALVVRLRAEGLECTVAKPNAVLIPSSGGTRFFPLESNAMDRVTAACMGLTHEHLTQKVGIDGAIATLPFRRITKGNLRVHHGVPAQLLYCRQPAPESVTPSCGPDTGGPLILYREEEGVVMPLDIRDEDLLPTASEMMKEASPY